jgi:UDP-N-acetylmuramate dehydrogenase
LAAGNAAMPQASVPLAPLTTLGVGGRARWYLRARTVEEVAAAHRWALDRRLPLFTLGGGSNIVIGDAGFDGLVLHVAIDGVTIAASSGCAIVHAGAGEPWDPLVARVVEAGYAGVECLSGIPGYVGGTPIQNVGAYGQEVSGTIASVDALDVGANEIVTIPAAGCGFGYRQSRFKQHDAGRFIVCAVTFRLTRDVGPVTYPDLVASIERSGLAHPGVEDIRAAVLHIRRGKGMVLDPTDSDTRSVGSFFMNPIVPASTQAALGSPSFAMGEDLVKIPAAWLIERAGFARGFAAGAVGLSAKHPLAIVNRGGARASEVVDLAARIKRSVLERFGVALRPEPTFVGLDDDPRVRFLERDTD